MTEPKGSTVTLHQSDCLDVLHSLPSASIDAIVTDPPYATRFMGRTWDGWDSPESYQRWCAEWARECLRVLKPGGHLLAFGGARTGHRLTCGIEDAGFEIRDTVTWLYSQGFPKSLDVSKAIDKAAGAEREVVGPSARHVSGKPDQRTVGLNGTSTFAETIGMGATITTPATDDARRWQGWGTALKPASEQVIVARKPLAGTVAQTVLAHGTGALNIDACRVECAPWPAHRANGLASVKYFTEGELPEIDKAPHEGGRWPSNVVLSHVMASNGGDACAEVCVPGCPVAELDAQSGIRPSGAHPAKRAGMGYQRDVDYATGTTGDRITLDSGGASQFFPTFRYQAKAPAKERPRVDGVAHPTVKPLTLMRWLVRLVCQPGGVVLEPFAGSGATVEACLLEGMSCIAVEQDATYLPLIVQRIHRVDPQWQPDPTEADR